MSSAEAEAERELLQELLEHDLHGNDPLQPVLEIAAEQEVVEVVQQGEQLPVPLADPEAGSAETQASSRIISASAVKAMRRPKAKLISKASQSQALVPVDGGSSSSSSNPSSGSKAQQCTTLAVLEPSTEDGRLLRSLILKDDHLLPNVKEVALNKWLIRPEFFDQHFEEFRERYSRKVESSTLEETRVALVSSLVKTGGASSCIERLEKKATNGGDLLELRDTLLEALGALTTPRRKLGKGGGKPMSDEAKALLKLHAQKRLIKVVIECLQGLWMAAKGEEILREAAEFVKEKVSKFIKHSGNDAVVEDAMCGQQWAKLQQLVSTIEDELDETHPRARGTYTPAEGKNTKAIIEEALKDLGGAGTSAQVIAYIEEHQDLLNAVERSGAKLNKNITGNNKNPVWHSTVRGVLSVNFERQSAKDDKGPAIWQIRGSGPARGKSTAKRRKETLALADAEAEEVAAPKRRKRSSPAALPAPEALAEAETEARSVVAVDAQAPEAPKRQRKKLRGKLNAEACSHFAQADVPAGSQGPVQVSKSPAAPKRPRKTAKKSPSAVVAAEGVGEG